MITSDLELFSISFILPEGDLSITEYDPLDSNEIVSPLHLLPKVGTFGSFAPLIFGSWLKSSLFFITGLIDYKKNISPVKKTIITFALLLILTPLNNNLVLYELKFENLFNSSLNLNLASLFITVFFIYIFLNLLNFTDGVNGVAISLSIFFITVLGIERKEFLSSEIVVIITLLSLLFLNIQNKFVLNFQINWLKRMTKNLLKIQIIY